MAATNSNDFNQQILELVTEACRHPPGHPNRQRNLTKVIRLVAPKLWRDSVPHYQDAVQKTWLYFSKHICTRFNPELGGVPNWLNAHLKRRLQDFYIETQGRIRQEVSSWQDKDGTVVDVVDAIADTRGDVEPIWEKVRAWAEADATGELRNTHIEKYPNVNCQVLILRRLLSETSWKVLSAEYGLPIPTLSSFYQRQCMKRLRKFGESEGYVESK